MIKRYDLRSDIFDDGFPYSEIICEEDNIGEWVRFKDVEASLNFAQQLKDEISAMLNSWDNNHKKAFLDKFVSEHLQKLRKLSSV